MKLKNRILCPGFLFLLINSFAIIIYLLTPDKFFQFHLNGVRKNISIFSIFIYLLGVLLFFLGTQTGYRLRTVRSVSLNEILGSKKKSKRLVKIAKKSAWIVFWLQILWIAYAALSSNGKLITHFLQLRVIPMKRILYENNLPGVTTFTLLSGTITIMYAVIFFSKQKSKQIRKKDILFWGIVVSPSFIRGMFFSERLALIENLVTLFTVYLSFYIVDGKTSMKKIKVLLKKLVTFFLIGIVIFILAESRRSFLSYHSQGVATNSIVWGLSRLMMYITSSIYMGLVIIENHITYNFPSGVLVFIYKKLKDPPVFGLSYYLMKYGSLEYNTGSGIGSLFLDLRYFSLIFLFLLGIVFGSLYKSFIKRKLLGLFLYPLIVPGIIDSYRLYYYGDIRFVLPVVYSIFIVKYLERIK